MAILKLKLDVTKLDKSAFFKGEKGTYCDLAVFINDEPDQYGNDASVKQDLGKDRRDEKLYGSVIGLTWEASNKLRPQDGNRRRGRSLRMISMTTIPASRSRNLSC
jgi:hypothetical protein